MVASFETIIADENPEVVNALAHAFGRRFSDVVRFFPGNIFSCGPGTIISPTNSEGDMSAGFDLQLRTRYPHLENRLQEYIGELPSKRLPIGVVVCIETGDREHPRVIFTPTLRSPWDLASLNRIRRAAFAVFCSLQSYNSKESEPIRKILMPGFGTGVGGVEPESAARKIFDAYRSAVTAPIGTVASPPVVRFQINPGGT